MGGWGVLAFDNDEANDWAYDLEDDNDLALVETAFGNIEAVGTGYLEQDVACVALAAREVLARLHGQAGYTNAYTEKVDRWVADHPMNVPDSMTRRGYTAIDRVTGDNSELRELWQEPDHADAWSTALADLRRRLG